MIFKENIDNSLESIGSGNKTFVVYKNSMNTVELVKYGWSWFAFLFSGLWLVYKGLYIKAVEIFVFSTLILLLGFPESIIPIISTGIDSSLLRPVLITEPVLIIGITEYSNAA